MATASVGHNQTETPRSTSQTTPSVAAAEQRLTSRLSVLLSEGKSIRPLVTIASYAGLVFAVFIFAGGFASARLYMEAGGTPADVVALRYGVSGLIFLPFVFLHRRRLAQHPGWWRALALAAVGGVPFGVCIFIGVSGAPFAHGGGIVPAIAMVLGSVLAWKFLGEALNARRLLGIAITAVALTWLLYPELGEGDVTWWGELAYFGAGILWAGWTVCLRGFRLNALEGAALAATFSLPYLAVYVVFLDPAITDVALGETLMHGFYQGVAFNTLAIGMYAWSVSRLGAAVGVTAMPLMAGFTSLMEWAIFDRSPHDFAVFAILMMVLGIGVAAFAGQAGRGDSETRDQASSP